jgi:hypothetical protein
MSERDDLRVRLARLDPAPPSLDPVESPRAQELLERTMSTPVITPSPEQTSGAPRRRIALLAAAAAVVAVAGVAAGLSLRSDDHPRKPGTTLTLKLPGGGVASSCMRFDVAILKDMSPAFAGTATDVSDTSVTISVDHWYTGGSADTVTLTRPAPGSGPSMEGGIDFQQGQRYLVTAAQGNVNGCGYSGPATAELEQAYAEAFGG